MNTNTITLGTCFHCGAANVELDPCTWPGTCADRACAVGEFRHVESVAGGKPRVPGPYDDECKRLLDAESPNARQAVALFGVALACDRAAGEVPRSRRIALVALSRECRGTARLVARVSPERAVALVGAYRARARAVATA